MSAQIVRVGQYLHIFVRILQLSTMANMSHYEGKYVFITAGCCREE